MPLIGAADHRPAGMPARTCRTLDVSLGGASPGGQQVDNKYLPCEQRGEARPVDVDSDFFCLGIPEDSLILGQTEGVG